MKIAVCEINQTNAEAIADVIKSFYGEDDVCCFTNIFSLVTYVYEERRGAVDLIILPTDVGGDDGIEAARSIQEFYPGIQVIFLSELTPRIQQVFLVKIGYLLLKPVDTGHLEIALRLAHKRYERDMRGTISLKFRGNLFRVSIAGIYYVESEGRKLYIYTDENKWETNMRMEDIRRLLPQNFFLCHRSYLVNTDYIAKVNHSEIELFNHMRIPVSRSRAPEVLRLYSENNIL